MSLFLIKRNLGSFLVKIVPLTYIFQTVNEVREIKTLFASLINISI